MLSLARMVPRSDGRRLGSVGGNVLEGSDGEEFEEVSEEWKDYCSHKEEEDLEDPVHKVLVVLSPSARWGA